MKKIVVKILFLIPLLGYSQTNKLFRKALKSTNSKEKIELFTKVIELEPKNFDAYFYRGIAKNDIGDFHGAIMDYSKIIVYEPDADTFYNRGNSKYSLQDYHGAKEDYENAYKLDASFIDALYNLACTKYFLEDYMGSVIDLNNVMKAIPNESKIYIQRANAYLALNKNLVALEDFSLAVLIDPNESTYYNRGITYLDVNYYKKANADFSSCMSFNSENILTYFFRGTSYLLLGEYKKALSDFQTALKYDALDYEILIGIALTHYKMNDLQNAKTNLKKAEELIRNNVKDKSDFDLFEDSYWFKKQYYFFKENYNKLNEL